MPLSPKRQRFVAEYLVDNNATAAAKRAGYSARTAKQQGSRLLTSVDVQQAVAERTLALAEKVEVNAEWVVTRLRALALGAAKESDRIRALELLGKHLAMFTERVQHIGSFVHPALQGRSIQELEAIERGELLLVPGPGKRPLTIDGKARLLDAPWAQSACRGAV